MPHDGSSLGSLPPSSRLRPGAMVAGKYRLAREIGVGGMGSVWIGWDDKLERAVTVKFMNALASTWPDAELRFEREARAAARLGDETDHVVKILDYGVDEGLAYIVMELLKGEDLGRRLRRAGRVAPIDALGILTQVARALKKAHAVGIVHRDLKPENIFLAQRDDGESVKLLDFGVVKELGPSGAPQITQPIGTLEYMSPEQALGSSIDHRTDLWSLAVVLYQALTGVSPFRGGNLPECVLKICHAPVPLPSHFVADLRDLDRFFERALARHPDVRYPSAVDLARAFAEAIGVSWRPPPSSQIAAPPPPDPTPAPRVSEAEVLTGAADSGAPTLRSSA
jgi:serine/threonine protein kinase